MAFLRAEGECAANVSEIYKIPITLVDIDDFALKATFFQDISRFDGHLNHLGHNPSQSNPWYGMASRRSGPRYYR